jgi:hypothetical protein
MRGPLMIAVADEWTVEPSAPLASRLQALVLEVCAVVLNVLVLAAAAQYPRSFGDYVKESGAFAIAVTALVIGLGVLLESMAAHAATLLANPQAFFVALLAAPHEHSLRSHVSMHTPNKQHKF